MVRDTPKQTCLHNWYLQTATQSDCCRGGAAYSSILLLGQQLRWQSHSQMGEQDNVLHYNSLWLVAVV